MQIGTIVKHFDADDPRAIRAYAALRAIVVAVSEDGARVRVQWTCDKEPEPFFRDVDALRVAIDGADLF
jgi:hypothetical protein